MPASPILLAAFVAENKGLVEGGTIAQWLAGVRQHHLINRAPWNGDDDWVALGRRTANREGSSKHKPPRPPVTPMYLRVLYEGLDHAAPLDAAIWAAATAAFWGCRRLGEVTVPTLEALDGTYHVLREVESAFFRMEILGGTESNSFRIPWTKTTREKGASVVLTGRRDELCPVRAMRHHLLVNVGAAQKDHLFAYNAGGYVFLPLVKPKMLARCGKIWEEAGLKALSGHAFRIGGATELLLAGVEPTVIASLGGWTSLAFLLYWRKIEEILPTVITAAYGDSRTTRVVQDMEAFRARSGIPRSVANALN